jgi:hypothetical protein
MNVKSPVLERLKLREPVAESLVSEARHTNQAHNWALIAQRLSTAPGRKAWAPRAYFALGGLCLFATLLFWGRTWRLFSNDTYPVLTNKPAPAAPPGSQVAVVQEPSELRLLGGAEFKQLNVTQLLPRAAEDSRVTFEDGSILEAVEAHTLVEALGMTARDVVLRLVSGAVRVQVTKGGPRKWVVEAGDLSVEVVGTRFIVTRTDERTSVRVENGSVLVRSQQLPDGIKRINAGEVVEIDSKSSLPLRATPDIEALIRAADQARQTSDLQTASTRLQQILKLFPNDPRCGVVAFQLAVVKQQLGAAPEHTVAAFETALSKARGQSLRQDCYWRLVLALEHAGQLTKAHERARESLLAFPNGRYASQLKLRVTPRPGRHTPPTSSHQP